MEFQHCWVIINFQWTKLSSQATLVGSKWSGLLKLTKSAKLNNCLNNWQVFSAIPVLLA